MHVAQVTMECCPHKNMCLHTQRSMAHCTLSLMIPPSLSTSSLITCTPIRPSTRPGPLQFSSSDEMHHCDDPINVSFGSLADLHSLAGYEPKDVAEEDSPAQVKPLFFHRPSMTSTCGSAECIATLPPESDLNDEQIRTMLVSPLYLQEREASVDRSRVYHSLREKPIVKFILLSREHGETRSEGEYGRNPFRLFQTKGSRIKKHFPTEKSFPQKINRFWENNDPLFRCSNPENLMKSFLEEHKDYTLAEAKSEVRKQECRGDFLDSSVRDLQRQLDSNRLEISKRAGQTSRRIGSAKKSTSRN